MHVTDDADCVFSLSLWAWWDHPRLCAIVLRVVASNAAGTAWWVRVWLQRRTGTTHLPWGIGTGCRRRGG